MDGCIAEERRSSTGLLGRWTQTCGNPECSTGWLRLWRSRSAPRLDGEWACSANCMEMMVAQALKRCISDWEQKTSRRELLMPLGLVMLSRGWITRSELHAALEAQSRHGEGQLGSWLCRQSSLTEESIAKALGAQWNCPALVGNSALQRESSVVPSLLLHRYGLVLLRHAASARLYLAGKSRAEHAAAHAFSLMLNTSVEPAFLEDSVWSSYCTQSEQTEDFALLPSQGAAVQICEWIEQTRPENVRVVRVHDHLWLRMWGGRRLRGAASVQDKVLPLRIHGSASPSDC